MHFPSRPEYAFSPPPSKILTAYAVDWSFPIPRMYYTPDTGTATPDSESGNTEAVVYEYSDFPILQDDSGLTPLFMSTTPITDLKAKFTSPDENENYGTVVIDTENKPYIKYTPNAVAAGKTIKFLLTAKNSHGWSDSNTPSDYHGIEFTVNVAEQPTDASNNADLSALTYTVDGGAPIDVPNFSPDITEYDVELPVDTEELKEIKLQGTLDDENAEITDFADTETDYAENTASITVTAENGSTQKIYKVKFKIKAPDKPYGVFDYDSDEAYKDGDTVKVVIGEEKIIYASLGSGSTGVVSTRAKSADMDKLPVMSSQRGEYPNIYNLIPLNIEDYAETQLTVSFYNVDVTIGETGYPVETITLNIKSVEKADKPKRPGSSHSLEETTGKKKDNNKPKEEPEDKPFEDETPVGPPSVWANGFVDVSSFAWYAEAVEFVSENNIMNGTSDKTFSPDNILTRGMAAQIFYNIEGRPGASSLTVNWYENAVNWALANNIASGYSSENFGAETPITTEQFTVFLYNYAKFKGHDVSAAASAGSFKDSAEISYWAVNAVEWTVGNGILNGNDGYLNPKAQMTRAQSAQMLMLFSK